MRSILNSIQSLYTKGATELTRDNLIKTFDCSDLFNIITTNTDPIENYKLVVAEYSNKVEPRKVPLPNMAGDAWRSLLLKNPKRTIS